MSVKYKVVEKSNPQNREEKKFYVQPIRKGTLSRAKLEDAIVELTSLHKSDVRGVLIALSGIFSDYLTEGYNLNLDDIGTFSLRVSSNGSDTEEEVSAGNVKNVSVGFRPAATLRETIVKTKFEKE